MTSLPASDAPMSPQPRSSLGRLPAYQAGKPPAQVPGLESYKLSSNENPFPPLPEVLQAIGEQTAVNRYPDPAATAMRQAISGAYGVPAADVLPGQGSLGALMQILATFAGQEPGEEADEVIYAWRSFEAYPILVNLAGARAVSVPNTPQGSHDLEAMLEAMTERTKVIILCTPNNPTGPALSHDEVKRFIENVPKNIVVILDEAYIEFVRSPGAVDGLSLYREYENLILLRTFSKAHGLAGLRVGYSIQGQTLTQHLAKAVVPFCVTRIAEEAAVASLAHLPLVADRVQALVEERERVCGQLAQMGWKIPDAQGNFVWLNFSESPEDAADFAEAAAKQALAVRAFPGEGVRVSIGEKEANSRFLELCRNYPKQPKNS